MSRKKIHKKIVWLLLVFIIVSSCMYEKRNQLQKNVHDSVNVENPIQTTEQQSNNNITESIKAKDESILVCEETQDSKPTNSIESSDIKENFLMPTEESIEEWKEDGSWEDRVAFYESLPNEVSPNLVQNLQMTGVGTDVDLGEVKGVTASMPSTGDVKTLVITCDFEGMRYVDGIDDKVEQWFNGQENTTSMVYPFESVSAYYERSSFGKLRLSSEFFAYHSEHTRDYYYDEENNYDLIPELIDSYVESIKASCSGTESEKEKYLNDYLKRFDSNSDGIIDGVYLVFSGETTDWGTLWWPHVNYYNGYEIGDYTFGSVCWQMAQNVGGMPTTADYYTDDTTAIIHETGHMLGLPDLYSQNGGGKGTLTFDMMDTNLGDHNAFFKMLLGWIDVNDIPIITEGDANKVQLEGYAKTGDVAVVIPEYDTSKGLYTEFYMLEYYESYGNDTIPKLDAYDGLRIYHINAELDESKTEFLANNTSCVADNITPLISAYDKDVSGERNAHASVYSDLRGGSLLYANWGEGDYECLYYEGDELTPYTSPASYQYDDDNSYYGYKYSGFFVKDINIENQVAIFTTGFETEKSTPNMEYEIYESDADGYNSKFNLRIYFETEIRLKDYAMNNKDAYIVDGSGEKVASVNMILYNYRPYNYITFTMDDSSVIDNKEDNYAVVIPEGTILSTYGTTNKEIRIPYNTKKEYPLEDFAQVKKEDFSSKVNSSDVDENGNGIYFFGDKKNTWNGELSKFDDPYGQMEIQPANYSMYILENFKCGEEVKIDVTPVENEQYMQLHRVSCLGNGKYGISWFSVIDSKLLFRAVDSSGQVLNERLIDISGCVTAGAVGNAVWVVYEDYYIIYDYEDETKDTRKNLPDIEETPTWFVFSDDIMVIRCLLNNGDEKSYIIRDGEIVYVDEGRDGKFGKSRAVDIKKIGDYYYYNTELLINQGAGAEYAQYIDVFDEDFDKIESYKLDNVLSSRGICGIARGFVVYEWSSLALYDKNFNYVKTLDISAQYFRTSLDSNNIVFVDVAESSITTKKITLSDLTRDNNNNEIVMPDGVNVIDGNTIVFSAHVKQKDFTEQFATDTYTILFESDEEYIQDGEIVSIGYKDERHTKYYKIAFDDIEHEYGDWESDGVDEKTDTHTKKCLVCGESIKEEHNWNEGEVVKKSTCVVEGERVYTCIDCEATKTEKMESLGHEFSEEWTADKEASCIEAGSKSHHCTRENCTEKSDVTVIPQTEHIWDEGTVTDEGEQVYNCTYCTSTKIGDIITVGHKYSEEWTVDKEASCGEAGSKSHHCIAQDCTEVIDVTEIPATGQHTYDEGVIQKIPTCVTNGSKLYTCKVCKHAKTEDVKATGIHIYGDWVQTKKAQCDKDGEKARICVTCTYQETEKIPATGFVKGGEFTKGNNIYTIKTIKGKKGTIVYERPTKNNKKTVKIPKTVKIKGKTYTVTEISAEAFKGNTKLKSVTIPEGVTKIGKDAFSGCKNLKMITIKSSKLKTVGKNAIKGIHKKATIKVPKKKLTKYKRLFKTKTGYKKSMKIKKN